MVTITVISITALIFAVVGLVIAVVSLALTVGLKNSTHKIEYKSFDLDEVNGYLSTKDLNKKLKEYEEDVDREFV